MRHTIIRSALALAALALTSCSGPTSPPDAVDGTTPTVEEAQAFVKEADAGFRKVWTELETAAWAYNTNITPETEAAMAAEEAKLMAWVTEIVPKAKRFEGVEGLDPETERLLGVGLVGAGAGELIAEGVLAIELGATVKDLAESVHPHPTFSETLMEAARLFYGRSAPTKTETTRRS